MEIALAAVADSANVSREGKLNVLGIFDTIRTPGFPCKHLTLVFAFRALFEYEDRDKREHLEVMLIDQDHAVLWSAAADIDVGKIEPGQFIQVNQIIQLNLLEFKRAGRYRFRIKIRGKDQPHDTVFQVVEVKG